MPGLWIYRDVWQSNPWTRCSFGSQMIMEPRGRFMLSVGFRNHLTGPAAISSMFEQSLQLALRRYSALSLLEPGSEEEAAAIERQKEQIVKDMHEYRPNFYDVDLFTDEILDTSYNLDGRFAGVFVHEDPDVRRMAAEVCGRYCERRFDADFARSEAAAFLSWGFRKLIQDPEEAVRFAAAVATLQLKGQPVPTTTDREAVIEAAQKTWSETAVSELEDSHNR